MLFKDEAVAQLLSGLNFQMFLCPGSRVHDGISLKADAHDGSLNFNDLPTSTIPRGGAASPCREGGSPLLGCLGEESAGRK
jgi:hypothetical protein